MIEQAKKLIAKKAREIVEKNWIAETKVKRRREKAKSYRNMDVNRHLLKMREDWSYEYYLKAG